MPNDNGLTTVDLESAVLIDQLLGNSDGTTKLIDIQRVASQINAMLGPDLQTRTLLYADLAWPAGTLGTVWGDTTTAYNGVYKKAGASGAGSWSRIGDTPPQMVRDRASHTGTQAISTIEGLADQIADLSTRPTVAETQDLIWDETGFDMPLISYGGQIYRSLVLDSGGLFVSGVTVDGIYYRAISGTVVMDISGTVNHPLIDTYKEITLDILGREVSSEKIDGTRREAKNGALVVTQTATGLPRAYSYDFNTGFAVPALSENIDYGVFYIGQSYPQGHDGGSGVVLTTTPQHPGFSLMPGSGAVRVGNNSFSTYADLFEVPSASSLKETMCSGTADAMQRRIFAALGRYQRIVFAVAANGGNRYWDSRYGATGGWKRGTVTWANLLRTIQSCRETSAAQGRKFVVLALVVAGLESDNFAEFFTGDTASTMRILDQIQSDFTSDACAITGQIGQIPIYNYQVGFPTANGLQDPVTARASLLASLRNPWVRCVGPLGGYDGSSDNVHLATTGYRNFGTYLGNFIVQDLFGYGETPLYAREGFWDNTNPILRLRFTKPLEIDSGAIINLTGLGNGKGIDFDDGSGSPPTINSIAVNGSQSRQLDVTFSAFPTGKRPRVHIGCRATGLQHGNQQGLRTAIRSAQIDTDTITSTPIYHWACTDTLNVPL